MNQVEVYPQLQHYSVVLIFHPPSLFVCPPCRGIDCDVSMENRLALRNTEMLRRYTIIDDRVKHLGYIVKKFAKVLKHKCSCENLAVLWLS